MKIHDEAVKRVHDPLGAAKGITLAVVVSIALYVALYRLYVWFS